MDYKDYYRILGVDKNVDEKEIKKAYRKLARQYHPDMNPGSKQAEERFKEINEAYEVLSDPDKRQKYDRLGASWHAYQHTGQDPSGFDWSQWTAGAPGGARVNVEYADLSNLFGEGTFSDFFQSIFGGSGSPFTAKSQFQRAPGRGQNVSYPVEVSLEEAFAGAQRVLSIDGKRLEVRIPAGVTTGSRVRVAGEGPASASGGPAGDLLLLIQVRPHPMFERDGDDLRCEVAIDLYTAVLGGEIAVPTITGRATLRIPEGTQLGQVFRLRGQGMPNLRKPDTRGNLLVKVRVQIPTKLTEPERQLFRELARLAA